ncbi:MAG TPA: Mur ligase domain-containing protein, partial [Dehalococcoidia bacterium]|nr:Mur ligase domain-containing protein [Dehalococcoidia bacterium]
MTAAGHVHLMGIGGVHMSAIAVLLQGRGWQVSGCDLYQSRTTERLRAMGIAVAMGHDPCHLRGADLLVYTAAVRPDNPELAAARAAGLPVLKRAEMVARLAEGKRVVAVAGCHGKTTTTSLVAYTLWRAGLSPTFLLGGEMVGLETNVMAGDGPYFVVEADEYDAAFLNYHPWVAAVTNLEPDHLDYYVTFDRLREAFARFLSQVQEGGHLVLWGDDPSLQELAEEALAGRRVERTLFGLQPPCQLLADDIMLAATGAVFRVRWRQRDLGTFSTPLLGAHNVRNCLAAVGVGLALGIEVDLLRQA